MSMLYAWATDDVPDILRLCDVYVSSSSTEALGYSILQAMSVGLAVVCTDVGGCKDLMS